MKIEKGFTLLEVLIAILVLSVGLLGVAAMNMKAMQSAHVSYQRSIAILVAQDAVERLWAELGAVDSECPDSTSVESDWHVEWSGKLPGMTVGSEINPSSVAGADLCDYEVSVVWEDDRFSDEEVAAFKYQVRLPGAIPSSP